MQTVKKPDEIAISPHHATSAPYRFDFVVVMLKQENTFLIWQGGDSDKLTSAGRHGHSTTDRSLLLMSRPRCGSITRCTEVVFNVWLIRKASIAAAIRAPSA